jgi:hypothetical protein
VDYALKSVRVAKSLTVMEWAFTKPPHHFFGEVHAVDEMPINQVEGLPLANIASRHPDTDQKRGQCLRFLIGHIFLLKSIFARTSYRRNPPSSCQVKIPEKADARVPVAHRDQGRYEVALWPI